MDDNRPNPFDPGHAHADDASLLAPHPEPFTPLFMFVCTFEAEISNLSIGVADMIQILRGRLRLPIVCVNSNFGNVALPGYEYLIKRPNPLPPQPQLLPGGIRPPVRRQRKLQGTGTCFNSAVEPYIMPGRDPGTPPEIAAAVEAFRQKTKKPKIYKMKCFPTTGKTQVPGIIIPDLRDGDYVTQVWADYLTSLPADAGHRADTARPLEIVSSGPNMLNYKFKLLRRSPRILLDLAALSAFLARAQWSAPGELAGPQPLFPVRDVKHLQDDVKISFKFVVNAEDKRVLINMFHRGKVNILGADSLATARTIYAYLSELLQTGWTQYVCIEPRPPARRAAKPPPGAEPQPPPAPPPRGGPSAGPPRPSSRSATPNSWRSSPSWTWDQRMPPSTR